MEVQILDYVLVPPGMIIMVGYHIWLLRRIISRPATTIVGINAINRRFWVRSMMEDPSKNGVLAVQTLRNNIMASTLLASTAIMLSSVIAVLMTGTAGGKGIGSGQSAVVIGDRSQLGFSIKFFSILVCFLLAFLLNVVSVRYYSHASILINVPIKCNKEMADKFYHEDDQRSCVTTEFVGCTVNRGSYFWSLGLRAYYFSFPLFMWIFGPIPMFLCCLVLVSMLYFLDVTFDLGYHVSPHDDHDDEEEVITSRV